MSLKKKPFVNYTLEEDKPDPLEVGRRFTVRLNAQEYKELKDFMRIFNLRNESTTLKLLAEVGKNVSVNTFGAQKLRWLFSPDRRSKEIE